MLALVPMETAEFAEFFEVAANSYAADNIANGRWNASDALDLAREESKRLLPEGEKTVENYLFVLRDTGQQSDVGYLWYGTMTRGTKKVAFLYQIYIHRSTAEAAMVAKPCMRSRPRQQAVGTMRWHLMCPQLTPVLFACTRQWATAHQAWSCARSCGAVTPNTSLKRRGPTAGAAPRPLVFSAPRPRLSAPP